jgi:hypothetical protein
MHIFAQYLYYSLTKVSFYKVDENVSHSGSLKSYLEICKEGEIDINS